MVASQVATTSRLPAKRPQLCIQDWGDMTSNFKADELRLALQPEWVAPLPPLSEVEESGDVASARTLERAPLDARLTQRTLHRRQVERLKRPSVHHRAKLAPRPHEQDRHVRH
eukprot:6198455-Pleurochrysis_carterae.AAC.2